MITMDQALKIKQELLSVLEEDIHNRKRILERFESIKNEKGITPYSALLLILTHLPFEENEARKYWDAALNHQKQLSGLLGRNVGLRVALFDYFINLNRMIEYPKIIELSLFEKLDRSDNLDILTGLPNQKFFRAALSTEMRRSKRYHLKCSIVILDLDDFKEVNEKYGFLIGDIILKEASMIIRNSIRDIDMVSRYGGEEFALILPETPRLGSYIVSERIRISAAKHFRDRKINGTTLNLTLSGGISSFPEDGVTIEEIISMAHQALYQAKAMGKNTINVYFQERRNFIRFDMDQEVFSIEILKSGEPQKEMSKDQRLYQSQNISKNGILFRSNRNFQIGEILEISFSEEEREILKIHGKVVRIEELEGEEAGKFEVGVAFLFHKDVEEQTLLKLIEKFRVLSTK